MKSGLLAGWMGRAASLSARRVWIEIPSKIFMGIGNDVTLREEGVD